MQHAGRKTILSRFGELSVDLPFNVSLASTTAEPCSVALFLFRNYERKTCVISHESPTDEPQSVAIHPSGYQLVVGYKDKLCMFHILMTGLKLYREITCKICKMVRFCRGGQYFAAAMAKGIFVYNTFQYESAYTFDLVHSFTGHSGPVNSLSWANDSVLFTAGQDGNIYGWTLIHGARLDNLNVLRNFGICKALVTTFTGKRFEAAACTSDGALHKLIWNGNASDDCQVFLIKKPNCNENATSLCFSSDNSFLFTGTEQGKILIYDWDSAGTASNCKRELTLHNKSPNYDQILNSVKCITISKDNTIISTGGIDGSLFISSMKTSTQKSSKDMMSPCPILSNQNEGLSLINIEEYEECRVSISDLQQKIETLKNEHEFNLHSKSAMWQEKMKELSESTDEILKEERYVMTRMNHKDHTHSTYHKILVK